MTDLPLRPGHADPGAPVDTCGCCGGVVPLSPVEVVNRPNLPAIAFRAAGHARHKGSMLAGLSSGTALPLADLGTRDDGDLSIALLDAWASALEVLGFYQERLANECFLGTATERFSLGELGRLVGYRLHPGAAAETALVLLLDDPPGAEPGIADLAIPAGTRVQSQPGPGETPQIFETLGGADARVAWNRLRPRQSEPQSFPSNLRSAWLRGTPQLAPGDLLLFVGRTRWDTGDPAHDTGSDALRVRRVLATEVHPDNARTRVTWDGDLQLLDSDGLRLFVMRERAALFGHNAPDLRVFSEDQLINFGFDPEDLPADWSFDLPRGGVIPLDAIYKSFVPDSWVVLTRADGDPAAYRVAAAADGGLTDYAVSGKSTALDLEPASGFGSFESAYRATSVHGASEELFLAERDIAQPVDGSQIVLASRAADLPEGRQLVFRGPRSRARVRKGPVSLVPAEGIAREIPQGADLVMLAAPVLDGFSLVWSLRDADGFEGIATVLGGVIEDAPARPGDEVVAEIATLDRVEPDDPTRSRLVLADALGTSFDRAGLAIHANVVPAAHGDGVTEILGAGDPSEPFQKFVLGQAPVTHRLAPNPSGVESTLGVRIDGVAWDEVPDLYDRGADAQVFRTVLTDDGQTMVEFGDGRSGARPPPGRDNIVADFSRGIGRAGNLRAGQLSMPLDRPLGLREAFNPVAATGGDDPEPAEDARRNVPLYTLTLGRVVSITDYRDFALGFPGIAKAESRWVWQGVTRRVVVTVAGAEGAALPPDTATHETLLDAFRSLGDPLVGLDLISYAPAAFRLALKVAVDPAYQPDVVLSAVEARLRADFGFVARDFAQDATLSAVAASAHRVAGVRAVDIDRLYRETAPQTGKKAHAHLVALPGREGPGGELLPAEILTLAPDPLDWLELMP